MGRIGILGGSFDPPHWGHIRLALAAHTQLALGQVLWVPAGQPPHKSGQTPTHHRVAMTALAIAEQPAFELCRLDVDRPGPHYTVDLLALLQARYGVGAALWFIVGEDSLRDLGSWYAPGEILGRCRLAVYHRPGVAVEWGALEELVPGVQGRIDWVDGPPIELSSSAIRRQVEHGGAMDDLVPPAVAAYVRQHGLYVG